VKKSSISALSRKNAIVANIIEALDTRKSFMVLGHKNPDEDCIASMVAFALLVTKFEKEACICTDGDIHEHFSYLLNICTHNSIDLIDGSGNLPPGIDTVAICDTPKPDMIYFGGFAQSLMTEKDIVKIEIDHHLQADSAYSGDPDYALVDEASSASELVGLVALKLCGREDLLEKYNITDLFSRNLVLAILTGIIGDSKMGKYLKSKREKRFYRMFSSMFNELLFNATTKSTNFSNKDEVFSELGRLSESEAKCYSYFLDKRQTLGHTGYVVLNEAESAELHSSFDSDTIISVSRSIADVLAEGVGFLSLVVFYDNNDVSDLVQFRMRRSQSFTSYDLRKILEVFSIENGGGHEGAIGFRIPRTGIPDIGVYTRNLLEGIETEIAWPAAK
jgi:nanoRNase/pAp phosphatase (c-di-AMP/oligoRNAs hydrolase)